MYAHEITFHPPAVNFFYKNTTKTVITFLLADRTYCVTIHYADEPDSRRCQRLRPNLSGHSFFRLQDRPTALFFVKRTSWCKNCDRQTTNRVKLFFTECFPGEMKMPYKLLTILLILTALAGSNAIGGQDAVANTSDRRLVVPDGRPEPTVSTAASVLDSAELDEYILRTMTTYNVAGVSAIVVKNGEVFWTGTYGMADFAKGLAVNDSTLFMLASVSKTVTGLALLQLWESGRFDLDDDINDYLPFAIVNPNYPDHAITFRMLLAHTSSLNDNWDVMFSTYVQGDSPIPLAQYVLDYFTPGGVYYDSAANFNSWLPGAHWKYCNHGFVVAGYLVEAITRIPFDQYCRDSIFAPLQMSNTSWFMSGTTTDNIAMPYRHNGTSYVPLGHFGYADYPAGALRSSTLELAHHLLAFAQFGRYDTARVLDSTTVNEIRTLQFTSAVCNQGLTWFNDYIGDRWVWRHGGGDKGVSTMISYCPSEQTGVIVLTNGESHYVTNSIVNQLYEYATQEFVIASASPSFGPAPLTVDFVDQSPTASGWLWDFGNGDSSQLQNPTHVYGDPGLYDVTLTIQTSQGEKSRTIPGMVAVHDDTLRAGEVEFEEGLGLVPLYAHNFLPLKSISCGVGWAGSIPMRLDSVVTTGTRSDFVEFVSVTAYDADSRRAAFVIDFTAEGAAERLSPGEGPVAILCFSDSGLVYNGSNPIVFTDFAGRFHEFTADAGQYQPTAEDGSLSFSPFCCRPPTVGDTDMSGEVDITDLQLLLDNLFLTMAPLPCDQEGNVNYPGSGVAETDTLIDITDVQLLVDHLFLSLAPLPACP